MDSASATYVEIDQVTGEPLPIEALSPVGNKHNCLHAVTSDMRSVHTPDKHMLDYIIIDAPIVLDGQARRIGITA
jgi:hypothetical protein